MAQGIFLMDSAEISLNLEANFKRLMSGAWYS